MQACSIPPISQPTEKAHDMPWQLAGVGGKLHRGPIASFGMGVRERDIQACSSPPILSQPTKHAVYSVS